MGWKTPPGTIPWTPHVSLSAMDAMNVNVAILSLPALFVGSISEENRKIARDRNLFVSGIVRKHPSRFGFFATLPFLDDIQGCISEIRYSYDVLNADGIALSSSYGIGDQATYIGDDRYDAIWAELHRRSAVVFLHGAQIGSSTPAPHTYLPIPVVEVPNETFKAAAHLVITGRKRKYPNVKIILAHLGGTTPLLAPRVALLSAYMGCPLPPEAIMDDFKSFYYETALSAYGASLNAIDTFVPPEQILFGTDFPAVTTDVAAWYTQNLENHYSGNQNLQKILNENAFELFPRLRTVNRAHN